MSQYLEKYRQFSECCSSLSRHLAAKDYDWSKMAEIETEIASLRDMTAGIYDGLGQLCRVLTKSGGEEATPSKCSESIRTEQSFYCLFSHPKNNSSFVFSKRHGRFRLAPRPA